jgi:hypothetical protein
MIVNLTEKEFDRLLLALGSALYVCIRAKDQEGMISMLQLANAVNRNNPNWTNYEVPNDHVNVTGAGAAV